METGKIAMRLDGKALYQRRARGALPLLVRQAHARAKIYYSDLAAELEIPNARTLNYPLGCIGTALKALSKEWGEDIPFINCLVVNKASELPGEGIGFFIQDKIEFKRLPRRKQRAILDAALSRVFAYPRWNDVLVALGVEPVTTNYKGAVETAAKYQAGGESEHHKTLKRYVGENPSVVGLPLRTGPGEEEYPLPSGDTIDVFFSHASVRTGVEVKSRISPQADITRGLFQCVKYRAVLNACITAENSEDFADALLVLEGDLPNDLRVLKTILDVKVIENVRVATK